MGLLLTQDDLEVWIRRAVTPEEQDWSDAMVEAASSVVSTEARQPAWVRATAPFEARRIACHLAARSFLNPDSILAEGAIGPVGGDRGIEELCKALHLTEAERAALAGLRPSGARGGLWVQPTITADPATVRDVWMLDDTGSDWPIPYAPPSLAWAFEPDV